jgi:hypothetical protein
MKSLILKTCLLTALSSVTVQAENLVRNGDFETGKGNAFFASPPWYNRGTGLNQGTNARSDQGAVITGSSSAIVSDRYVTEGDKLGPSAHVQKTDHTIQEGDSFTVSYEWRPADRFWQRSTDTVRFVLYATANDKLAGPVVWSSELTSEFFEGNITNVTSVFETSSVVSADAAGSHLFVMFYGVDTVNGGTDGTPHFARVDNIEIKAISKGEAP